MKEREKSTTLQTRQTSSEKPRSFSDVEIQASNSGV